MADDGLRIKSILDKGRKEAEERDAERRAKEAGIAYINLATQPVETDALELIPEEEARAAQVATIEKKADRVVLVVFDPTASLVKKITEDLEKRGLKLKTFVVSLSSLNRAWEFYRYVIAKAAPITGRINIDKERIEGLKERLTTLKKVREEINAFDFRKYPTAQILEIVLAGALASRASDIHFESAEKSAKLRYRIDGDLHDVMDDLLKPIYGHLVSRIKLLSNLKLNVRDEAQDGRFTIGFGNKEIELRIAIAPSEFGEVIVMRVLDPDAINLSMQDLGLRKDDLEIVEGELKKPNGLILNTGPTGSGKTTTLYAFLKDKSSPEVKIITIEDPIEYHVIGIEQTQVNPEANYTFANGLRSLMRQDPDVILIGEIRDKETAEIAIQAALTGHLVFSTVHANQAAGALPRLVDLGVKPTSIGPALNLIIAQRLVKRLCGNCKVKSKLDSEIKNKFEKYIKSLPERVDRNDYKEIDVYEPKGCEKCRSAGYKGRVGIYELLMVTKEIEQLMSKGGGELEIVEYAMKQGMVTMQQDGVLKVIGGLTTLDEVEKVTGPINF
ncbi:MAG: type II/IV secretion system protein [Candidatus Harrisonbacteria bacterium]|nr:type II/IV secretion system protein [Candidatus Harrisonbacteria bacterium]